MRIVEYQSGYDLHSNSGIPDGDTEPEVEASTPPRASEPAGDWMSTKDAAAALGYENTAALRKDVEAGELTARKDGRFWQVWVPEI